MRLYSSRAGLSGLLVAAAMAAAPATWAADAEVMSADDIAAALTPTADSRGLTIAASDRIAVDLPSVTFEFNSFRLTPLAERQLAEVGKALSKPGFRKSRFVIAGHTDAVGSEQYNQSLSERRADTVIGYLEHNYGLTDIELSAVGWGESRLLPGIEPDSAENRRVEIVNLGAR